MRYIITALALTFFSIYSFSQKTTTQLEIDRLYKKYKDKETLTISFPNGTITTNVKTYLNKSEKPYEIELFGTEYGGKTLSYFLSYFIKQKATQGFKENGSFSYKDLYIPEVIQFTLERPLKAEIELNLQKGKEYCIIIATKTKKGDTGNNLLDYEYTFSITNGDMRRKGGDNAKPLDF